MAKTHSKSSLMMYASQVLKEIKYLVDNVPVKLNGGMMVLLNNARHDIILAQTVLMEVE